jgi:hypothetical protein
MGEAHEFREIDYSKKPFDGCLFGIFYFIIAIIGLFLFVRIISNLLGIGNVNV